MSQQRTLGNSRSTVLDDRSSMEMLERRTFLCASPHFDGGERELTVMTQNLYIGFDLARLAAAQSPLEVPGLVADAWKTVQQTDFPSRAKVIAREIARGKPDLVALQEASLWRFQENGDTFTNPTPATEVKYDYIKILIKELAKRGLHYKVAAEVDLMDMEMPDGLPIPGQTYHDIRYTDRNCILARVDEPASEFKVVDSDSGQYAQTLPFPVGTTTIDVPRGWTSVDAKVGKKTVHVVETQMEAFNELVQLAQTQELLTGPANSQLPTILLGDFNSDVFPSKMEYNMIVGAGFTDAWTQTHSSPGLTWGHNETLRDSGGGFTERDDLILFKGDALDVERTRLVDGALPYSATGPLWASDHAGLFSTIEIASPVKAHWWHGHKSVFDKGDDVAAPKDELVTV